MKLFTTSDRVLSEQNDLTCTNLSDRLDHVSERDHVICHVTAYNSEAPGYIWRRDEVVCHRPSSVR